MRKTLILMLIAIVGTATTALAASVSITAQGGWLESAYVEWQKTAGTEYNVYVSEAAATNWVKLDKELVREYPACGRADALGLKAGTYRFRVVPVANGSEVAADAAESATVEVRAHDRSGFAHHKAGANGIGAYNNDGTLKADARVVYVWADNAKTVSLDVVSGSNGKTTTYTGLQDIIYGYQKGDASGSYDKRPLDIRIIGTIKAADMDEFKSSAEGIQIKGAKSYQPMNITIEGVGHDANVYGFGFLIRSAAMVELRNFGIMLCMDDCVSIDTDNEMIWVHNLDLFYGNTGGDADQAKGDGTVDMKGDSRYLTVSYNHFYDSGKSSLCGMKSETGPNWITYHHNWFDHSDSRHPRIRTMSVHVWNNYFDGNSKYGVGAAYQSEAFVENNYFRNCKYPMLSSLQGSDVAGGGKGTFSGEYGGVIKSFGNVIVGARSVVTYQQDQTEFDCWEAGSRNDQVPAGVKAKVGGKTYSNFDTDASIIYSYTPDAAADVPAIVKGQYGAGRLQHGDFTWTFNNSIQDENYDVIGELKTALQSYRSTLTGFFGGTTISNGGATETVNGGDGKGISEETNNSYVPSWAGGGGVVSTGMPDPNFCGAETEAGSSVYDYLWFNAANKEKVDALIADGLLTYSDGSSFSATRELKNSDGSLVSKYTGSLQLPSSSGSATFKCVNGLSAFAATIFRTGSASGEIQVSTDGSKFTKIADYSDTKGDKTVTATTADYATGPVWVRITNKSTGSLHITGVKIMYPGNATTIRAIGNAANGNQQALYDLCGRRVTAPKAGGVYIQNGRKVVYAK
ncbi:MAG: pectate lyase [Prevotella sp.]|nr:pectate lyase [Prevotella sp.]